jgi:hypothetical protein
MLRHNPLPILQDTRLPPPVTGSPSRLRECVVVALNPSGSVNCKTVTGRGSIAGATPPAWYGPALGDHVLVGDLNGDERTPVIITPLRSKGGGSPGIGPTVGRVEGAGTEQTIHDTHVTATGPILLQPEGSTPTATTVVSRSPGASFVVKSTAEPSFINYAIFP